MCSFIPTKEIWPYSHDLFIRGGPPRNRMIPPSPDRFDDKNALKWNLWKGRIAFNKRSINDLYMIVVFFISSEKKPPKIFLYTAYMFDVYGQREINFFWMYCDIYIYFKIILITRNKVVKFKLRHWIIVTNFIHDFYKRYKSKQSIMPINKCLLIYVHYQHNYKKKPKPFLRLIITYFFLNKRLTL